MCTRRCSASDGQWARHALRDLNEARRGETQTLSSLSVSYPSYLTCMKRKDQRRHGASRVLCLIHIMLKTKEKGKLEKRKTDKKKMGKNGKRNKGKIGNAGISASAYPASAEASTVNRRNQIAAQAINPASMQPSFGSRQQTIWAIDGLRWMPCTYFVPLGLAASHQALPPIDPCPTSVGSHAARQLNMIRSRQILRGVL